MTGRRIGVIVAVALCALGLSAMPASAARTTTYRVTISAPAESPLVNVTFAITGSVSPAADGATVHLQEYIDGGFKIVASTQLDASSNYRFTQKMANVGGYVYRVVKPAGGGILEGISPLRRVWVTGATMRSGPIMKSGNSLVSSDGTYQFTMLTTGDLVITVAATGHVLWSLGTDGHPGAWATLRNDGDLVVHASDGSFLKDTGSGGHPLGTYTITMEDDSNLVMCGPHGVKLWSSQTARDTLQVNEALQSGQFLTSANDQYQVVMETGGDLVVLDSKTDTAIWDSFTGTYNSEVTMQDDGNLDLKGPLAKPLWSSRTPGHPGATATIEDDGDFVVSLSGVTLWASMGINGVLGDDYPNVLRNSDKDSLIDPWRFYNRECVSLRGLADQPRQRRAVQQLHGRRALGQREQLGRQRARPRLHGQHDSRQRRHRAVRQPELRGSRGLGCGGGQGHRDGRGLQLLLAGELRLSHRADVDVRVHPHQGPLTAPVSPGGSTCCADHPWRRKVRTTAAPRWPGRSAGTDRSTESSGCLRWAGR